MSAELTLDTTIIIGLDAVLTPIGSGTVPYVARNPQRHHARRSSPLARLAGCAGRVGPSRTHRARHHGPLCADIYSNGDLWSPRLLQTQAPLTFAWAADHHVPLPPRALPRPDHSGSGRYAPRCRVGLNAGRSLPRRF